MRCAHLLAPTSKLNYRLMVSPRAFGGETTPTPASNRRSRSRSEASRLHNIEYMRRRRYETVLFPCTKKKGPWTPSPGPGPLINGKFLNVNSSLKCKIRSPAHGGTISEMNFKLVTNGKWDSSSVSSTSGASASDPSEAPKQ